MGRLISLILFFPRLLLAFAEIALLSVMGLLVSFMGCEIRPLKRPEDKQPLTQDAEESEPEKNNDDEIRRTAEDLSPSDRLDLANRVFSEQGALVDVASYGIEPISVWGEKRDRARREAAQRN